jgi:acyl-CoA thioester hydrolase
LSDPVPAADPFRFFHRLRVRWGECDMQGIVFNPHYMAYFDIAFTEYWRTIGMPYPAALLAEGSDNFMVAANLNFRDSARYDDELDIGVRTEYFGSTSFRVAFSVRREGRVLVDGVATYVIGDARTRKPKKLPVALVERVTQFEYAKPATKV